MKIMLVGLCIVIQSFAMQQKHSPNSLFKAVKEKKQEEVLAILLAKLATLSEFKSLPAMLEWQSQPQRRTALLQATIDENLETAQMLVAVGANMFTSDLTGNSPFFRVFSHGQIELFKVFMQTRSQVHKDKMELNILNNIRFPRVYVMPNEHLASFVDCLFSSSKIDISKYRWLHELALASRKADNNQADRLRYVRLAPLYKKVAVTIIKHNEKRRNLLIEAYTQNTSYFSLFPLELRHLVVDFLDQESREIQQEYLQVIKKMPES